jgi:hypothetical protein
MNVPEELLLKIFGILRWQMGDMHSLQSLLLTCRAFYPSALAVYWKEIRIGVSSDPDEPIFTAAHRANGTLVRRLIMTTSLIDRNVEHSIVPDLSLFSGLQDCYWRICRADPMAFPDAIASLVPLNHLSRLHLSASINVIPSSLRQLAHRLHHLTLTDGVLKGSDFLELVSMDWPMLRTLELTVVYHMEEQSGDVILVHSAVSMPSLVGLCLNEFPLKLDFISFFKSLPTLSKLSILKISNIPSCIDAYVFPTLTSLRAPISLVRAVTCNCSVEYIHIVGSRHLNYPQLFHFLHGKALKMLVCEYGMYQEHVQLILSDPILDVKHAVFVKKIVVQPVCVLLQEIGQELTLCG